MCFFIPFGMINRDLTKIRNGVWDETFWLLTAVVWVKFKISCMFKIMFKMRTFCDFNPRWKINFVFYTCFYLLHFILWCLHASFHFSIVSDTGMNSYRDEISSRLNNIKTQTRLKSYEVYMTLTLKIVDIDNFYIEWNNNIEKITIKKRVKMRNFSYDKIGKIPFDIGQHIL